MVSFVRITVLSWADMFAAFAMYMMMNYLTDVWNLSTLHAAGILNIWSGITQILPIIFALIVDAFMGDYCMLVVSSISYTIGLGFLSLSTPPVLGPCSEYKEECIGHKQKVLFFTGLVLIAVGMAGQSVSLKPFLEHQVVNRTRVAHRSGEGEESGQVAGFLVVLIVRLAGAIAIPLIKTAWSFRFKTSAICTLIATFLFLSGSHVYKYSKKDRPSPSMRIGIHTVVMWLTFMVIGVVLSIGNTYFIEQANRMDRKLGKLKVPIEIFLVIYNYFSEAAVAGGFSKYTGSWAPEIATTITCCVLCCITAAKVETRRLHAIRDHGLLDKPNEIIPMTIFWLIPQFALLGIVDGMANYSISRYFKEDTPRAMHKYTDHLTKCVLGLGTMASVLSVHIVGKVSERNQSHSWFQPTLNESRFDRYYWTLAALGAVTLVLFLLIIRFYVFKYVTFYDDEESEIEL